VFPQAFRTRCGSDQEPAPPSSTGTPPPPPGRHRAPGSPSPRDAGSAGFAVRSPGAPANHRASGNALARSASPKAHTRAIVSLWPTLSTARLSNFAVGAGTMPARESSPSSCPFGTSTPNPATSRAQGPHRPLGGPWGTCSAAGGCLATAGASRVPARLPPGPHRTRSHRTPVGPAAPPQAHRRSRPP
jgi:hypothetical protein